MGVEPSYIEEIMEISRKANNIDDFISEIEASKGKLGFFARKEKKFTERIIKHLEESGLAAQIIEKQKIYEMQKTNYEGAEEEINSLRQEYQATVLEAWGAEDKIKELTGKERMAKFPSSFYSSGNRKVEEVADLKRLDRKTGKEVGRYAGWFDATQRNPKASALYRRWEATTHSIYTHVDPRKEKGDVSW